MTNPKPTDVPQTKYMWLRSVRFRLLVIAIMPMLVVMPLLLAGTFSQWSTKFDDLLIAKVNGELTIAHQYVESILETSDGAFQMSVYSGELTMQCLAVNQVKLLKASKIRSGINPRTSMQVC